MAIGPDGAERNVFLVPMVYIAGDVFVLAAFRRCQACFTSSNADRQHSRNSGLTACLRAVV